MNQAETVERIKTKRIAEAFIFSDDPDAKPRLNLEKLQKYIKFYTKSQTKGNEVENIILRKDMIECKAEMFSKLPEDKQHIA